jgi:hypothetical protein
MLLPWLNGERWRDRYDVLKEPLMKEEPAVPMRPMPLELGPAPAKVNPLERCNLSLLHPGLACGTERGASSRSGTAGDSSDGTAHLLQEVQRYTGRVCWIDTPSLPCG